MAAVLSMPVCALPMPLTQALSEVSSVEVQKKTTWVPALNKPPLKCRHPAGFALKSVASKLASDVKLPGVHELDEPASMLPWFVPL